MEVLVEQNINGKTDTAYIYGAGIGSSFDRLSLDRFDGSTGYYLYDPNGNVTGITNEIGQVYQSYRYDAFGQITFGAPQYENEYTYNGESYNPNIESQYLRARYYNVISAVFITEDTYLGDINEPLTLNRYLYCLANPLNFSDPSGNITNAEARYCALEILKDGNIPGPYKADVIRKKLTEMQLLETITNTVGKDILETSLEYKILMAKGKMINSDCGDFVVRAMDTNELGEFPWEASLANGQYIANKLLEAGWSKRSIAAALGNMSLESYLNPGQGQKNGSGYGLAQWDPSSQLIKVIFPKNPQNSITIPAKELANGTIEKQSNLMDLEIEYLINTVPEDTNYTGRDKTYGWQESNAVSNGYTGKRTYSASQFKNGYLDDSEHLSSVSELTFVFATHYERAGDLNNSLERRKNLANVWYYYLFE